MTDQFARRYLTEENYSRYSTVVAEGVDRTRAFTLITGLTEVQINALLRLSGTPFQATAGGSFTSDSVLTTSNTTRNDAFVPQGYGSSHLNQLNDNHIKVELKKRHLKKNERDSLHRPASDVTEGGKGEVCKNACTLELSDIIIKYK